MIDSDKLKHFQEKTQNLKKKKYKKRKKKRKIAIPWLRFTNL